MASKGGFPLFIVLLLILMAPAQIAAHPHVWIAARSTVLFDGAGQISGLRIVWKFDPLYTVFAVDGLETGEDGLPKQELLHQLAAANLGRLKEYSYFTYALADKIPVPYGEVTEYDSSMEDEMLTMGFTLPLEHPIDPHKVSFSYSIYDPTYYIEILHEEENPVQMEGPVPTGCGYELKEPNPDAKTIGLAASLDKTESIGNGLGIHFAQWVVMQCS